MRLKGWQTILLIGICILTLTYTTWKATGDGEALSNSDFLRFHVIANSDTDEDQNLKLKVRDGILEEINLELTKQVMAQDKVTAILHEEMAESEDAMITVGASQSVESIKSVESMSPVEPTDPVESMNVRLSIDDARNYVSENLDRIEDSAKRIIESEGYDYTIKSEIGVRWIKEKTYENVTFPAGNYEALTITIGEGKGENWWCVLFPPLCLIGVNPPADMESGTGDVASTDGLKPEHMDEKYAPLTNNGGKPSTLKIKFKTLELMQRKN